MSDNETLEGMARASRGIKQNAVVHSDIQFLIDTEKPDLRAAMLWLADNVSDEMERALVSCKDERGWKPSIAAALRAAVDGR